MKTAKPSQQTTSANRRLDRLFDHWWIWLGRLYGDRQQVPTLDSRSCIAIDRIGRDYVLFCVSTMTLKSSGGWHDELSSFYFTQTEARAVFNRYHRLKAQFSRLDIPTHDHAAHLRPRTWTKLAVCDWRCPSLPEDIPLFIASLISCWDSCIAKPPPSSKPAVTAIQDEDFWDERPLPKFVRLEGLPPGLARQLRRHAIKRQWARKTARNS
jgi:hypothetical protein